MLPRTRKIAATVVAFTVAGVTVWSPNGQAAFATNVKVTTTTIKAHTATVRPRHIASIQASVQPGAYCRLTLAHPRAAKHATKVVRSALVHATSGYVTFSWKVAPNAWGGRWNFAILCAPTHTRGVHGKWSSSKRGTVRVIQPHKAKTGTLTRRVNTSVQAAGAPVSLSAGIGGGGACQPYGTPLVQGSSWLGGKGVTVYSNGSAGGSCWSIYLSNGQFAKYQCVELVERLIRTEGWSGAISGNANQLYGNASTADFDKHPNGSGYTPVPGDILVWGGGVGGYGHTAVVAAVSNGWVDTVEQNNTASGTSAYPITSNGSIGTPGKSYSTIGVLHAKKNGAPASSPAPTPPPPPSQAQGPAAKALATVNLRTGPGTSYAITRTVATGTIVHLSCYAAGTSVSGPYGTESTCDKTTDGDWVADALVYTGSNSPVVSACSGGTPGGGSGPTARANGTVLANANIRSGPGTGYSITRSAAKGSVLGLYCYSTGTAVTGTYGTTTIWDQTVKGDWISDALVYTGSNSAVVPHC